MARALEFSFEGETFACEIEKLDRSKLYGTVNVETVDQNGKKCVLTTLGNDGRTLIPSGGTSFGYFNTAGEWVERSELMPVNQHGQRMNEMPSSFKAATPLDQTVEVETLLDHSIRLVYRLNQEEDLPENLQSALVSGEIYKIIFSYRGGVDPDTGFVMMGKEGGLWLLVGDDNNIAPVGLEEVAASQNEEVEDAGADEGDGLDFGMM